MKITEIPAKPKERKTIRVAAYARVSSDKDAAFHSLEAQTEYYEDYVAAHPDWELVSIYSDNGISGTIINRPEFQRMLEDCRAGKIDLVVTKSVTRFARNTIVLLETVRELKRLGVDCYFEKEDMHSISPDGELLLTLLAMYAEEEARSASENQKWRIQKMFEAGHPNAGKMLGYRLAGEKLIVVPEEAETVRKIFNYYLLGMGYGKISKTLIAEGITPERSKHWQAHTLFKILTNEKYTGDLLLQKTFREDFRTKKKIKNTGQRRMYYVKDSHEAIIDKVTFQAVQAEMANRRDEAAKRQKRTRSENLFSGMITCGNCGYKYARKNSNGRYSKIIWICLGYFRFSTSVCRSSKIPESILIEKTKSVLGVEDLTREILVERICHIVATNQKLTFYLKNGACVDTEWEYASRSTSWTPEMRQAAREKTLARQRKEEENAESNDH